MLKRDGIVWATGRNNLGQLGDGTTSSKFGFVQVQVITSDSQIMAQAVDTVDYHSLVVIQNGSLWVTGYNSNGQLGTQLPAGTSYTSDFIQVIPRNAVSVAAGAGFSIPPV